jgi:hypothetical protein
MYYFVNFFTVLFPELESKLLDVIGTKVLKVFPIVIHIVTPGQKWFESDLQCKHYILKSQSENSQEPRNLTEIMFMNSASGQKSAEEYEKCAS